MKRRFLLASVVVILAAVAGLYVASATGDQSHVTSDTFTLGTCPSLWPECAYLPIVLRHSAPILTLTPTATPTPTPTATPLEPFYGMEFVPEGDLGTVKGLGTEVVLWAVSHDGTPESWLAYLDEAQAQGVKVITWLWPQGWNWNGNGWQIDAQARSFVQTVAGHPALFAVYALHEPVDSGYTTAEQQALYDAIKALADVPIYSETDSMSLWETVGGEECTFEDGICDYCATWYYPFFKGSVYDRDQLIDRLTADLSVTREQAPNSKFVWLMQSFASSGPYRMPTADEMRDLASIVYSMDVDGALWYVWQFDPYSDFLSNDPELYPVVREIYEDVVLPRKH